MLFLENYLKHKKKFEECLKLNSWNYDFFVSALLLLFRFSFQLRYYRMNENSKCDISFIYADTWHATQNKSFRSDLWTSRTLKMCQYQNPWVTKPVLCPFLNNWKYSKIVVRVFRAQLGLTWVWKIQVWPCLSVKDIDGQCKFPQSPRWAIRVSTILT